MFEKKIKITEQTQIYSSGPYIGRTLRSLKYRSCPQDNKTQYQQEKVSCPSCHRTPLEFHFEMRMTFIIHQHLED